MEIDLARQLVRAAFKASLELELVLQVAKAKCSPDEYPGIARGIAAAIDSVSSALIRKAIAAYPELEAEIDEAIRLNGRY